MKPAVFLDRDGVIIENRDGYVRTWADVEFYPHTLPALARLSSLPVAIVIVTNQSAIGRGILKLEDAVRINQSIVHIIQNAHGRVDGVYMCPHAPEENCLCRKPRPGLLLQAARELDLDLSRSLLIGDALSDILAAKAAGLPSANLVLTGRGRRQLQLPNANNIGPYRVFNSLSTAIDAFASERSFR